MIWKTPIDVSQTDFVWMPMASTVITKEPNANDYNQPKISQNDNEDLRR